MKQKKEINVIYIITKLELGGAQKICLSLFEGLEQAGNPTHLITSNEGILINSVHHKKNVIVLSSLQREVSALSFLREIRCFFELIRHLKTLKKIYPNVQVHTHSTKAGILGRWAAWFAGIKNRIHTIHGFAFHPHQSYPIWLLIFMIEWLTSFITTHFICVSSEDVKTGLRFFPRFGKRHSIIRAAVDWNQFFIPARQALPFPAQKKPFIFGTVSCFKRQKNIVDLLRAFAWVHSHNSSTRLELVGDGNLRPAIMAWIQHHGLTKVITLHGWQKQVAPIMAHWHAFVLSSLWEGLPCSIVEARLLKLPVISYDTGGIHDVIITEENGLLCKQGDWEHLAQNMLKVVENKKLYSSLQQYPEDLSDFNTNQMIKEHLTLYETLSK